MNLSVCASATDGGLVSLTNLKEALSITDTANDALLTRMIARSSRRIETYLGRTLGVQVYRAVLPAYGRTKLRLPAYPVRHVFKVWDGTDTGSGSEIQSTQYTLDAKAGFVQRDEGFAWTFQTKPDVIAFPEPGQEYGRYLVEFSAGYILSAGKTSTDDGTTTTGVTLDADLEEACIMLTRNNWFTRLQASTVTGKRVGELAISYGQTQGGLSSEVESILAPYRSIV